MTEKAIETIVEEFSSRVLHATVSERDLLISENLQGDEVYVVFKLEGGFHAPDDLLDLIRRVKARS